MSCGSLSLSLSLSLYLSIYLSLTYPLQASQTAPSDMGSISGPTRATGAAAAASRPSDTASATGDRRTLHYLEHYLLKFDKWIESVRPSVRSSRQQTVKNSATDSCCLSMSNSAASLHDARKEGE